MLSVRASRFATVLIGMFCALLAASLAHVAIDVLGDVLLSHDAYDGVPHGTRGLALALGLAATVAFALRGLAAALGATTAGRLRRLACARSLAPRLDPRFLMATGAAALVALIAMEALDTAAAGTAVDDLADLLGGSVALGLSALTAATIAVVAGVRAALAAIAGFTLAVARAVRALAERCADGGEKPLARDDRARRHASQTLLAALAIERGPPLASSAAS